jgi:hypothetical protein
MKQLLLIFGFVLVSWTAQSQVYAGQHRLDTLNKSYISGNLRTNSYMNVYSCYLDLGEGDQEAELTKNRERKIKLSSVTEFITIMSQNGWTIEQYEMSGVGETVLHVFIFKRREKEKQ